LSEKNGNMALSAPGSHCTAETLIFDFATGNAR